ncbi:MAG: 4a-hydroxytetrahydrobiopterin dehydratase [bacterium]|nr:4a-hydroxytetrahydrobiopterin dehydratase [bacterium]
MWQDQNNQLYKEFKFKDFNDAFNFMKEVAAVAEVRNHHPRWLNEWNKVQFWLYTHSAGGVTEQDESLAQEIDEIFERHQVEAAKEPQKSLGQAEIKLYADGGSRGNPGPSAGGFVLLDMSDQILHENGKYIGITTNNQAEYHSLKGGLEAALRMGAKTVHVYMDSMLVVNQMKGLYKVKNRDLWPIYEAIKKNVTNFDNVTFTHVPREFNKLADGMVNKTLDSQKQS